MAAFLRTPGRAHSSPGSWQTTARRTLKVHLECVRVWPKRSLANWPALGSLKLYGVARSQGVYGGVARRLAIGRTKQVGRGRTLFLRLPCGSGLDCLATGDQADCQSAPQSSGGATELGADALSPPDLQSNFGLAGCRRARRIANPPQIENLPHEFVATRKEVKDSGTEHPVRGF